MIVVVAVMVMIAMAIGVIVVVRVGVGPDAFDVMVVAFLGKPDLGLEAQHLRRGICTSRSSSCSRRQHLAGPGRRRCRAPADGR